MSGSDRRRAARLAFALVAATLPWMLEASCVPKGACLRHSDCPKDQRCVDGECAYPSATAPGDGATIPVIPPADSGVATPPTDSGATLPSDH